MKPNTTGTTCEFGSLTRGAAGVRRGGVGRGALAGVFVFLFVCFAFAGMARADQSVTVLVGKAVTLSVTAEGTQPFTYQWSKDGVTLSGATGASYTIPAASSGDAGIYSVVVSNAAGSTISDAATLTVETIVAPAFTSQPTAKSVLTGSSVSFVATVTGTSPVTYQWRRNGANIVDGGSVAGATTTTLTLTNVSSSNAGTYTLVATNAAGTATSTGAALTVTAPAVAPAISSQPVSRSVTAGATVTFAVTASGSPSPSYQWLRNGAVLANGGNVSGATTAILSLTSVTTSNAATYSVVATNSAGSVTSSGATLTVAAATVAPAITTQPASQSVIEGHNVVLTAAAGGNPAPVYQWRKDGVALVDGVNLSGVKTASLSFIGIKTTDAGVYTVVATNSVGSVTSSGATLTVEAAAVAPAITTQPVSQSVIEGLNVVLTAAASGNPAPVYQWRKDGVALVDGGSISGAKTASLSILGIKTTDAGVYTVVATNSAGSATSSGAAVTVSAAKAPKIVTHPSNRKAPKDTTVTLSATVEGSPEPTYRWTKDGVDLSDGSGVSGSTSTSLTLASVDEADVGTYVLKATNLAGSVSSVGATVTLEASTDSDQNAATDLVPGVPAGFDVAGYLQRNPSHALTFGNDPLGAWEYYRDHGIFDGELFDDLFRPEEYLALYPELLAVLGADLKAALIHWLEAGMVEGRLGRIPTAFNAAGYFERNPDVAAAMGGNPILAWQHFWKYGIYEGRAYDDDFRAFEYLALNPDLMSAFSQDWRAATLHWLRYGSTEGRLGRVPFVFDVNHYLTLYPDVGTVWGTYQSTVFQHFWYYGVFEARNFDDSFRVDDYLALNPDVATVVNNNRQAAFMHWVRYGRSEGRPTKR